MTVKAAAVSPLHDYERARNRLLELRRPKRASRKRAWEQLVAWQELLQVEKGIRLPAPWIFSNETGAVEFEWERGDRQLTVTLSEPLTFTWSDSTGGRDRDAEGTIEPGDVPRYLHLLFA